MDKKVILINKMGCMLCERILYEITHERKLSCNEYLDTESPKVFNDFIQLFQINRFPVIQIDDGVKFITIHRDEEATIESKPDMEIIFCSTVEEMMETFDKMFAS